MIVEVLFWGVVVGAVLFAVTAADIVGEIFAGIGVNVLGKLPFSATGRTGVAGGGGFIRLEEVRHGLEVKREE
jgi:predicted TIM-barrel enzyme